MRRQHFSAGCSRGQSFAIDIVMAVIVFSLLFVFFVDSWQTSVASAQKAMKKNRMEFAALSATDMLVKSAGSSNSTSVSMAGFASSMASPYRLSPAKMAKFAALNYSAQKSLLGMQGQFSLYISDLNGTRLYEEGNFTAYSDDMVSITRYAVLNGNIVKLGVTLYG